MSNEGSMTEMKAGQLTNAEIGRRVQILSTSGALIADQLVEVNHLSKKVWVSLTNVSPRGLESYTFAGSSGFWVDPESIVTVLS